MRKPTPEKVLKIIEAKAKQGFDFTVNVYSYRDAKLRKVIRQLRAQNLVDVEFRREWCYVTLKG